MALHHNQLIDHSLHFHTARTLNGSNRLSYYVHDATENLSINGYQTETLEHNSSSEVFIQTTFNNLGKAIAPDFIQVNQPDDADIRIYSVSNHLGWKEQTVGQAIPNPTGWTLLWKNTANGTNLSDFDANTIIHELGHAMGLAHPSGEGTNPLWTTDQTVMSYNMSPDGWDYTFSEADQHSLVHLWGAEPKPVATMTPPEDLNRQTEGHFDNVEADNHSDWTHGHFSILLKGSSMGNDRVVGTSDNDVLVFGEGRDRLRGATGSDLFLIPGNQRFNHRTADRIFDFNANDGDVISLVANVPDTLTKVNFATAETHQEFIDLQNNETNVIYDKNHNHLVHDWNNEAPGLGAGGIFARRTDVNLQIADTKRESKLLAKTDANMIYFSKKGQLFFNSNGTESGFGDDGGLVARLKGQPSLSTDNLQLWSDLAA